MRLLLAVLVIAAAAWVSSIPEGSIEDFVAHELQASGAPGLAYAVVTDGRITTVQVTAWSTRAETQRSRRTPRS